MAGKFPIPDDALVVAETLIVSDIARSRDFYADVLGGEVVMEGGDGRPAIVQLANTWVIINVGGGPTDDKPSVVLTPPLDLDLVDSFLNLRVADIRAAYDEWRMRGAHFLTEPKDHEHEIRAYIRDPDGYLIEVGQSKRA